MHVEIVLVQVGKVVHDQVAKEIVWHMIVKVVKGTMKVEVKAAQIMRLIKQIRLQRSQMTT